MADKVEQLEMLNENQTTQTGPVTCLGMTFENDEARRAYFTEELRKKLPELRKIEGFPIGEDEDILALSDPPYYTACPNPWIEEIINYWVIKKESKEVIDNYNRKPFAADVSEGKYDPIYRLHPYHTKVPHKAIMRYILHYTEPGDIVFDGFCGTGMTGVAANMCGDKEAVISLGYHVDSEGTIYKEDMDGNGNRIWVPFSKLGIRRAVLNDLSPAATFIASKYNSPIDFSKFKREAERILKRVEEECSWMYETTHNESTKGKINYVIWSDVFICPECLTEIVFWDVAVDFNNGEVLEKFQCPHCTSEITKRNLERSWTSFYDNLIDKTVTIAKQVPVRINYSVGNKRYEKIPDENDMILLEEIQSKGFDTNVKPKKLPMGDKTGEPIRVGINFIHQMYTIRNYNSLSKFKDISSQSKYWFILSMVAFRITKRYGLTYQSGTWGAGGGPTNGTYYIPSLSKELNILRMLRESINKFDTESFISSHNVCISNQSSSKLQISDNSIDYIFIDPPFGSNLNYSELNLVWETWLGAFTNNCEEAIESKSQKKSLIEYRQIMTLCFKEAYRILKPGRWMTVEFSNTKASVWNNIQTAIADAGFVIANVSALDKKKGSFNAQTNPTSVKQDLVISAYKPNEKFLESFTHVKDTEDSAWNFVKYHLEQLPVFLGEKGSAEIIVERTPRILFDRMVAYHVQNGLNVPISSAEFQSGIEQRFPMRDGMAFLETQVAEYDKKRIQAKDFVQLSLFVSDENSAIEWLRQQLLKKPQTRQDLHPNFMKEIQHIAKHEMLPELDVLLEQNFLMYDGEGEVPSQIHTYLSSDYKDLRNLPKNDPKLIEKAKNRWYVPDPNKQADLEKLREKSLLREFNQYVEELSNNKKKLKQFRTEAIRVGFYKAWTEKNYQIIVDIGNRLPESILQEDEKLLRYYDNAQTKLGL